VHTRSAAALLALALVAAGCGGTSGSQATGSEDGVTAFSSVYALSWIAQQVAPDAELTALGAGGDPHDVDLSSEQREAVESSDVVLYLGDIEFQPQVEEAVAESSGQVVSAAEVVGEDALLQGEEHGHDEEGEEHAAEESEEHAEGSELEEHADEEGGEHADEEGGEHADDDAVVDPHLWFSAALMAQVAEAAAEAFAAADPDGAETYRANAQGVAAELTELDGELAALYDDCERDEAIVSHEAYAYLLEPYGKSQVGIAGVAPEAGATSADITSLVEEVRAEGITTVLAEPEEGRADAETLARETGIDLVEISPLESVSAEEAELGYPALLRQQAEAFATAFGCA